MILLLSLLLNANFKMNHLRFLDRSRGFRSHSVVKRQPQMFSHILRKGIRLDEVTLVDPNILGQHLNRSVKVNSASLKSFLLTEAAIMSKCNKIAL